MAFGVGAALAALKAGGAGFVKVVATRVWVLGMLACLPIILIYKGFGKLIKADIQKVKGGAGSVG